MAGEWEAAVEVSLAGVATADARSLGRTYGAMIRGNAAEVLLKLGRWEEAEALTRQALALHDRDYQGTHVLHMRALLLLGRGRFDEARGTSTAR